MCPTLIFFIFKNIAFIQHIDFDQSERQSHGQRMSVVLGIIHSKNGQIF